MDYPCFKETPCASWEQQKGAVSPTISSARCCRIQHSSAAFQEYSAKFPHSDFLCHSPADALHWAWPPGPSSECQLALREEADFSARWCSVPRPRALERTRNTSACYLGSLAS